ncbi:MAG: hypothetical protein AAF701_02220 [Pseudomonadota bacterium]
MKPVFYIVVAAGMAVVLAVWAALSLRLPLPFPGFAAVVAGVLAGLTTLTLIAWMPQRWVWSDREILRLAFQAQHNLAARSADNALTAIVDTHDRANRLRLAAKVMRDDMATEVTQAADRLDAAARDIFYTPSRLRALQTVLVRSQLIDDAATAHARLRNNEEHSLFEERPVSIRGDDGHLVEVHENPLTHAMDAHV